MKKLILLITFSVIGFILTTQSILAQEAEEEDGIEFEVKYFETYEELQEYKESKGTPYLEPMRYHFGETSFSNSVFVRNGFPFYNLATADIESTDRKSYELRIYNSDDEYMGKAVTPVRSGWIHTDFRPLLPRGRGYKIKLYNPGSGTMHLKQGDINYQW